jgi:DNA repair ATPase RecN
MAPLQMQTELNRTAADVSALRKEVTAQEFQSRNDPQKLSEVESKLAAAEQSCRKCACVAGEVVAQQERSSPLA